MHVKCPGICTSEYFSEAESFELLTYRELLDVPRCLQMIVNLCAGKFVVILGGYAQFDGD